MQTVTSQQVMWDALGQKVSASGGPTEICASHGSARYGLFFLLRDASWPHNARLRHGLLYFIQQLNFHIYVSFHITWRYMLLEKWL